jgi:hypothetical protein
MIQFEFFEIGHSLARRAYTRENDSIRLPDLFRVIGDDGLLSKVIERPLDARQIPRLIV